MPGFRIETCLAKGPIYQLVDSVRGVYRDEDGSDNRTSPLKLGICTIPVYI